MEFVVIIAIVAIVPVANLLGRLVAIAAMSHCLQQDKIPLIKATLVLAVYIAGTLFIWRLVALSTGWTFIQAFA